MVGEERRRSPRIKDDRLSLKLNADGFDLITHTLNISASGVYCKVEKEMPIMSRVRMMLKVPDPSAEGMSVETVEVNGVIVRQHPVIIDGQTKHYDVAIFFEDLSQKGGEIISNYVSGKKS